MSNQDPTLPNNPLPIVQPILGDGQSLYKAQTGNTTCSAVAVAGTVLTASKVYQINNYNCRGAIISFKPTAYPASGSATVALKVQYFDSTTNMTTNIATIAATSLSTGAQLLIYPGISTSALGINAPLPRVYQLNVSLSIASVTGGVTFGLGVQHIL